MPPLPSYAHPAAWKTACIAPVLSGPVMSSVNDLRPVALSSLPGGPLSTGQFSERFHTQFAYRRNRSTDDAVLFVLENVCSHLEKSRQVSKTDAL